MEPRNEDAQPERPKVPDWVESLRAAYSLADQSGENSVLELGRGQRIGQIDAEISSKVRGPFFEFISKVAEGLPQAILLEKRGGGILKTPFDPPDGFTAITPFKKYYLPKTSDIYKYYPTHHMRHKDPNHKPEDYDPESPSFIGIEQAKENRSHAVNCRKVNPTDEYDDQLTDEEISIIMEQAEKALVLPDQRAALDEARSKIDELEEERKLRREQARQRHGEILQRCVENLIQKILGVPKLMRRPFPTRFSVEVVKEDDEQSKELGGVKEFFFLPKEARLMVAPVNKARGLLGKMVEKTDLSRIDEADVKDWTEHFLFYRVIMRLVELTYPKYRHYILYGRSKDI